MLPTLFHFWDRHGQLCVPIGAMLGHQLHPQVPLRAVDGMAQVLKPRLGWICRWEIDGDCMRLSIFHIFHGAAGLAVSGVNWALVAWFAIVVLTTSIMHIMVLHCAMLQHVLEPISGSYFKPIFLRFVTFQRRTQWSLGRGLLQGPEDLWMGGISFDIF